jgi:hypothetical protein
MSPMAEHQSGKIEIVGRETARYSGPEGEVEFFAFGAIRGRAFVYRGAKMVEAIDAGSLAWAGDRAGQPMSDADRARILDAIRRWYRSQGIPYNLRHPSGEVEDETGARDPGFRSALPRVEHSEGWTVTDLYLSPEHPDPDAFPPTITYAGPEGTAELRRDFELVEEVRHERFRTVSEKARQRVLRRATLRWTGTRAREPMSVADRERILERIRSVYDEWGYPYEVRE